MEPELQEKRQATMEPELERMQALEGEELEQRLGRPLGLEEAQLGQWLGLERERRRMELQEEEGPEPEQRREPGLAMEPGRLGLVVEPEQMLEEEEQKVVVGEGQRLEWQLAGLGLDTV
uniref:Zinc finger protein 212 n=1 Tax=Bursaphelenchus xylophilus TaxID=6326 RepID=A0A1I7RRR7_BURXY